MFAPVGEAAALDPGALREYAERLVGQLENWQDLGEGLVSLLESVDSADLVAGRRGAIDSLANGAQEVADRLEGRAALMEAVANGEFVLGPGMDLWDILSGPIGRKHVDSGRLQDIFDEMAAIALAEEIKKASPREVREILASTPADQLDAAIAKLNDEELEKMVEAIEEPPFTILGVPIPGPWFPGMPAPVSADDVYVSIGERLSLDTLRRIGQFTERINPTPNKEGAVYTDKSGEPLYPGDGTLPDPDAFNQGQLGDCYFIISLIAIGNRNPQQLADMVQENANGTYTVTFADGKKQVVTPDIVTDANGNPIYANSDDGSLYLPLIEKAFAQRKAAEDPSQKGYDQIGNGGWPDDVVDDLIGESGGRGSQSDHSPDEMKNKLDNGDLVFIATHPTDNMPNPKLPPGIFAGHAYQVTAVDTANGTVTLVNPHDANATPVTLTMAEYEAVTQTVIWSDKD